MTSRAAFPRPPVWAELGEARLAVEQLVLPNRKVKLADAPGPYVLHLQAVCGYPGQFGQSVPLALCSPRPVGKRQALAVVRRLLSSGKSDASGKCQSSCQGRG